MEDIGLPVAKTTNMAETHENSAALQEIIDKISSNNAVDVESLISKNKINANACDDHGMSLLQHAAYKGNHHMVQLLLDQGADVNGGKHEHNYTALHFAALSGKTDVVLTLLNYGAKVSVTNSVGRTAAQMAAFVGNHACVAIINNFISKSELDYYTKCTGQETEPKLLPLLAEPLHKLITGANLHPVKIALNAKSLTPLCEHLDQVAKVLEIMSEREMKRGMETNEIMSFKLHYLSCILAEIARLKKNQESQQECKDAKSEDKKGDPIEPFIKKMLRVGKNGEMVDQHLFLVDSVRSFHARDCAIFRQMVSVLARADAPSALSVVTDAVNGQRAFADLDTECWSCGQLNASKKCSKCRMVKYCDRECQRIHWFVHKKQCNRTGVAAETHGPKVTQESIKAAITSSSRQMANVAIN